MFGAGTPRNGIRTAVRKVIRSLGYDVDATIAAASINHALWADQDYPIPTSMFGQIFAHCAKATSCSDFGMLVGAQGSLSWLGRIGFMAQHADNVASALNS